MSTLFCNDTTHVNYMYNNIADNHVSSELFLPVKVPTAWPYRPICFHTAGFRPDDESIFVIYILCRCCVTCLKKLLLHVCRCRFVGRYRLLLFAAVESKVALVTEYVVALV